MNLKILMLSTSLGLGGADKEVIAITSDLINRGHKVKIVSMVPPGTMGIEAKSKGLDVTTLKMNRGVPDPRAIFKLVHLVNKWKPDVLHSHMIHANLLARAVRFFCDLPVLISTAQNIDECEGHAWRKYAYRFSDFLSDRTVNVSKLGAQYYVDIGLTRANKIAFIPNSVDTEHFYPDKNLRKQVRESLRIKEKFVWLAVGRFYLQKDYPTMIAAFAQTLKKYPNCLLLIAGEGPLQAEIEKMVVAFGIQSYVRFLGPRRDILALMNAVDAHILSSQWEGTPLVLLEAAASGLPIVATNVGGVSEAVLDDKTGILVPSADSNKLSFAMEKLMNFSTERRERMGIEARNHVLANYSTNQVVSKWEELYFELLKSSSNISLKII
jgi:glycosyltransferase involved in cell wall biosynthesis